MKKVFLILGFISSTSMVKAQQWDGSSNTTGLINRAGNIQTGTLLIGKYGSSLSGDPDPYNISSPDNDGDHDLFVYGSGSSSTLNLRIYDGSIKLGSSENPNAQLFNSGSAFFSGSIGIGTNSASSILHLKEDVANAIGPVLNLQNNQYGNSDEAGSRIAFFGYSENRKISIDGIMQGLGKPHRLEFNFEEDGTVENTLTLKQNGSVGIGTNDPSSALHLKKDVANTIGPVLNLQNNQYSNSDEAGSRIAFFGYSENRKISIDGIMQGLGKPHRLEFNFEEDETVVNTMTLKNNGSVGINTDETGSHKLAVEGSIGAREIKVEAAGWSDFVFESDYNLRTLEEVEQHIKEKGHLPEIPNEAEVIENGINLGEMNAKLLQKIEELTLYILDQEKRIKELEKNQK